jgi:hypothetical protein
MSANIGIKLMAVAVILAMANLLSGYYGLRSPGVFAHSLEGAHDILVRDFVLSLAISGADYDVVDREDAGQLSVIADDRKPRRLLSPHGFERGAYALVQSAGVNIPRHHIFRFNFIPHCLLMIVRS